MNNEILISKLVSELINLGAQENRHSDRTLLDHLLGVFHLLNEWKNTEDICLAGLFHSIYGTINYKTQTVSIENRQHIKSLIGDNAERLAFLFCRHDTKIFVAQCSLSSFKLIDASNSEILTESESIFNSISEIHIANLVEQVPFVKSFIDQNKLVDSLKHWLPVTEYTTCAAKEAFQATLKELEIQN